MAYGQLVERKETSDGNYLLYGYGFSMSQNTVCVTSLDLIIESSPKTTYSPVIQLFLYGNNEFTSLAYTDTTEFFSI